MTHPRLLDRTGASLALGAVLIIALPPVRAQAEAPEHLRQHAAELYDRAVSAFEDGDYATAGRLFEDAHRVLPSDIARDEAIEAYRLSERLERAATLALEQPKRYRKLLARSARTLLRLDIECGDCELSVDGEVTGARALFVAPDVAHELQANFSDRSRDRQVVVGSAGERKAVTLRAPARVAGSKKPELSPRPRWEDPPLDPPRTRVASEVVDSRGMFPPALTYSLAAASLLSAGLSVWSALDSGEQADDYERALVRAQQMPDRVRVSDARSAFTRAEGAHTRTLVTLGVTAGLTAVTAVSFLFTDWRAGESPETPRLSVALGGGGAMASIGGQL